MLHDTYNRAVGEGGREEEDEEKGVGAEKTGCWKQEAMRQFDAILWLKKKVTIEDPKFGHSCLLSSSGLI